MCCFLSRLLLKDAELLNDDLSQSSNALDAKFRSARCKNVPQYAIFLSVDPCMLSLISRNHLYREILNTYSIYFLSLLPTNKKVYKSLIYVATEKT